MLSYEVWIMYNPVSLSNKSLIWKYLTKKLSKFFIFRISCSFPFSHVNFQSYPIIDIALLSGYASKTVTREACVQFTPQRSFLEFSHHEIHKHFIRIKSVQLYSIAKSMHGNLVIERVTLKEKCFATNAQDQVHMQFNWRDTPLQLTLLFKTTDLQNWEWCSSIIPARSCVADFIMVGQKT